MAKRKPLDTRNESRDAARDLGNRKHLTVHDLVSFRPQTKNQEKFAWYFMRNFDLIIQRGSAGTGKTVMAMYYAMLDVFNESTHYQRIIYVKPCVEERARGFVPGDLEQKDAQYEIAIREATNTLLNFNDGYDHMKSLGYLEFATTGHRGRTFFDSIVICDEAQNYDYNELSTLITRVDESSRMIVIGDERQDDLQRHREKSGLDRFVNVCHQMEGVNVGTVIYKPEDNVRKGLSRAFCMADYYYED